MEGDSGAGNVLMSLWCFAVERSSRKKGDARGIELCKYFYRLKINAPSIAAHMHGSEVVHSADCWDFPETSPRALALIKKVHGKPHK